MTAEFGREEVLVADETGASEVFSAKQQSGLKKAIYRAVPAPMFKIMRNAKHRLILFFSFYHDFCLFDRYSSAVKRGNTRSKLGALITMNYHGFEKGLALGSPRPGFGAPLAASLIVRIRTYTTAYGWNKNTSIARNVLEEYRVFNKKAGALSPDLDHKITALDLDKNNSQSEFGGTKIVSSSEIHKNAKMDLAAFFQSRSSIRQFTKDKVDRKDIEKAVTMARKTPSVCNRQSGRVIAIDDHDCILRMLNIQGGAKGFDNEIPMLLVVSSDLSCFQSAGERYQAWIDGGMFAMSLVYALHSLGLGTCCLNWSKAPRDDKKLYAALPSLISKRVIMMIAVGQMPMEFRVAQSISNDLPDVLDWFE